MTLNNNLLKVVAEDLDRLRSEWDQTNDEVSARLLSPVLRRLLVDGDLQKVWRAAGFTKSPGIKTYTLASGILADYGKTVVFASAGGALYDDIRSVGFVVKKSDPGVADTDVNVGRIPPKTETLPLNHFLESPCMAIQGNSVLRQVLIKYVANKLGGAHYDSTRGESDEQKLYGLLDHAHSTYAINGTSVIYYELLSIGQAVTHSEDIVRLCEKLNADS